MNNLPTPYQNFIHLSRYARYRDDLGRRELWPETIQRWENFWTTRLVDHFGFGTNEAVDFVSPLSEAILALDVMPSMRSLMTAGPALERDNVAGFNCAYVEVDEQRVFSEIMYILMCGTGVGFSVERQCVKRLPEVPESLHETGTVITVHDSKLGWCGAYRQLVAMLYSGQIPKWDTSAIRPKGARLKTFGGRASGPEPLEDLFQFTIDTFKNAVARYKDDDTVRLTSIECHDLVCKIADIVVVGGVRRSALISLSNLTDERMQNAKNGQWWNTHPHRQLANNSAAYTEKPDFDIFMKEVFTMHESKAGERGIFSRVAAKKKAADNGRRDPNYDFGTNPCGEIILRSAGFCNLSEAVLRPDDSMEAVLRKVEIATIIGTLQSTLTNFDFLREKWRKNAREERLLGVSLTGIMDHPFFGRVSDESGMALRDLRQLAIDTNKAVSEKLSIEPSAAITTVKPSGTVSQLVNSASGIHPRYSAYYIRRVRQDIKDPITTFMIAAGVPYEMGRGSETQVVFSFPMASPPTSPNRKEVKAMDQLALYAHYRENWCEHNPSTTIYYVNDDFFAVMQWVWENFDRVGGVSFLPSDDHTYQQAPYEEITKEVFDDLSAKMPLIDWSLLSMVEKEDNTNPAGERSCVGGACEL